MRQLWNQRRQNGWIFVELVIVSFFLWTVIDPLYVLTANRSIDPGYREKGTYVLNLGRYNATHGSYDPAMDNDSIIGEDFLRIARVVRNLPEVESYSISSYAAFPNSPSWTGSYYVNDTIKVSAQRYDAAILEGSNLFRTYGMKDAKTGGEITIPADCASRSGVFISERMARLLFGTVDAVGKKMLSNNRKYSYEVMGVFRDYKHRDNEQPYPMVVEIDKEVMGGPYMHFQTSITFHIKDGVKADAFEQRFQSEVGPTLSIGNFYFMGLKTFSRLSRENADRSGVTNTLRLKYSLAGFALLCVFLGMVGTFWIRCNARRQEIGLMRSMGSTCKGVTCRFLTEAWLLVTGAFVVALPLIFHNVHQSGFALATLNGNPAYWQNQPVTHFVIVTLIAYTVLLVIALVGTYIPVSRATRILPADALRDE